MPKAHLVSNGGHWLTDGAVSLGAFVGVWAFKNYLTRKAAKVFHYIKGDTMALDLSKDFQVSHEFKINMKLDKRLVAQVKATYEGTDGAIGELTLSAPIRPYLAKLKVAIPGQWDDVAIDLATKAAEVAVGAEEVAVAAATVAQK